MRVDLNIKELVILWHLLDRAQQDENYWNKTPVDFDDDDYYEVELPPNFKSNGILEVREANDIAKSLREKLFDTTYNFYSGKL
jgi:hypothetical protein